MPPLASAQVRPTDSVGEVVQRYERHGFPTLFKARPGGNVRCEACDRETPARWVGLLALHRLETGARPTAVAAVECPACEERGTLALSVGPAAPVEHRLVLSLLDDRRGAAAFEVAPSHGGVAA